MYSYANGTLPCGLQNLEKAGFINTEGMDSIYANVSREENSN